MKKPNGVDIRLMQHAAQKGINTGSLEPFDTVFSLFGSNDPKEELDMIRMALAGTENGDAMITTVIDSYFAGDHRMIWEFSRLQAYKTMKNMTKAQISEVFLEMETAMLTDRNVTWMDVILKAGSQHSNIVVAAGAAHLSGNKGVLFLLGQAGYEVSRVDGF